MVAPIIVRNHFTPGRLRRERGDEAARQQRLAVALSQATGYLLRSDRHGRREPRTLFDRRTDGLALADVRAHLASYLGERAAFHRLAITLHPSLEIVTEPDAQRWARAVLAEAFTWLGACHPAWVAATHRDTAVLHVHAVMGGRDARGRDLVLRPPFFALVRRVGVAEAQRIEADRAARARRLSLLSYDPERRVAPW